MSIEYTTKCAYTLIEDFALKQGRESVSMAYTINYMTSHATQGVHFLNFPSPSTGASDLLGEQDFMLKQKGLWLYRMTVSIQHPTTTQTDVSVHNYYVCFTYDNMLNISIWCF